MVRPPIPADIIALADERRDARVERDWGRADELRARIEAAGWRVIDAGMDYRLEPSRPADIERDGETVYGAVESVPSRLDEPDTHAATVVVVAERDGTPPGAALQAVASNQPEATQVLLVAAQDTPVTGPADEIVHCVESLSPGDALQAGVRRAAGSIVIALDPGWVPTGDFVTPLLAALANDEVAIAGIEGLHSIDLRRYQPAGPGDATAVRAGCYAFRRRDAAVRGPLDGRLHLAGSVAAWWSLTLRDEGPDAPPRRALALDLPLRRSADVVLADDHARSARRDAYRIADAFRRRRWLAAQPEVVGGLPGDGTGGDDQHDGADEKPDASES